MKYRRRQWWLRRIALGLAVTAIAALGGSPAYARPDAGVDGTRYVTGQGGQQVIPYLSHGILTPEQAGSVGATAGDEIAFANASTPQPSGTRPDDRADRVVHSDVTVGARLTSSGWELDRQVAAAAGFGLVLGLALAFGLAVVSRRGPKLAGQ
jgi:hypothetical protein